MTAWDRIAGTPHFRRGPLIAIRQPSGNFWVFPKGTRRFYLRRALAVGALPSDLYYKLIITGLEAKKDRNETTAHRPTQ